MLTLRQQTILNAAHNAGIRLNVDYFALNSDEVAKLNELTKVLHYKRPNPVRTKTQSFYYYLYELNKKNL